MANRSGPEARHQQSVAALLEDAAAHGWHVQTIEHDGIRQYRCTKVDPNVAPLLLASAYFEWVVTSAAVAKHPTLPALVHVPEQDEGKWRFVLGFTHDAPERPLRLTNLRAAIRGEHVPCAGTGLVGKRFCDCTLGRVLSEEQLDAASAASLDQGEH